jgi:hypothetical protein
MKSFPIKFLIALLVASFSAWAQVPSAPDSERGFTEIETFQGTLSSPGNLVKLDSTLGYDFNKHFGVFTGLPLYFTSISSSTSTTGTTTSSGGTSAGIGNFYLGLGFRAPNPALNYASTITVGAPTGSVSKGLSTGRATLDWSNHVDRSFSRLTPFLDAGLGNTVPDSGRIVRPFTSLGGVGHFEEGAEYALTHHFGIGGSGYEITPFGNQKVFSKLVRQGGNVAVSGNGHGVFQNTFAASGTGLTRENGVSTWVAFQPTRLVRAELGYTRSVTYDINSFSFNLGLNVGKLLRSRNSQ